LRGWANCLRLKTVGLRKADLLRFGQRQTPLRQDTVAGRTEQGEHQQRRNRQLRDSRPFGVQPSVETLGYSRLSLRDTNAAVCPRRQYSPVVRQYGSSVMTSAPGREG